MNLKIINYRVTIILQTGKKINRSKHRENNNKTYST